MINLKVADQIAQIILPYASVNAMSPVMVDDLHRTIDSLEVRQDWHVLGFNSDLKVSSSDGELKAMSSLMKSKNGGELVGRYSRQVQDLLERISCLKQVTLAVCWGSAIGGGLELALA